MRLITFDKNGRPALGIVRGDRVADISALDPDVPQDWATVFATGVLERLRVMSESVPEDRLIPYEGLRLLPPIPRPPKLLCVGLNYTDHAAETGAKIPSIPIFFIRFPSSIVGHGEPLVMPKASDNFDFEAELVIVIGHEGRHIPKERALDHVAGYSCFNDGSLRDFQKRTVQWTMGKNFDKSGSFGPEIVTADALPAGANGLKIGTRLNGEVVQDGNTRDMIFDVATLVEAASEVMTLEPGTVIATGTPAGVGLGRKPPLWMKPGDTVEVEIEGIGTLRNKVVAEG